MDLMWIGIALVVAALAVVVIAGRRGSASGTVAAPDEAIHPDETVLDEDATDEEATDGEALYEEAPDEEEDDEEVDDEEVDDEAPYGESGDEVAPEDRAPNRHASVEPAIRAGTPVADGEVHADDRATPPPVASVTAAPAGSDAQAPDAPPKAAPAATTASALADACPNCGSPMVERVAKRGPREGKSYMACSRYPTCRTAFEIVGAADGAAKG